MAKSALAVLTAAPVLAETVPAVAKIVKNKENNGDPADRRYCIYIIDVLNLFS